MRDISDFLDRLKHWTSGQDHIVAVALVGSFARGAARDDSDVDVMLFTDSPALLLENDQWLDQFGRISSLEAEDWGLVQSRRVFYADGLEIEFSITGRQWAAVDPVDAGTRRVISDGVQILSDPHGLLVALIDEISNEQMTDQPNQ